MTESEVYPLTTFFVDCIPPRTTSQQKGVFIAGGKPRFFKKKKVKNAENTLMVALQNAIPKEYKPIMSGPIWMDIHFCFPYRASDKRAVDAFKRKNGCGPSIACDTRPDVDNMSKVFIDCMTKSGMFRDDAQVSVLWLSKSFDEKPGIFVQIRQMKIG